MTPIRLAIVEDDPEVRQLVSQYLHRQPEFDCVIVADSAEAFLAELPDAVAPQAVLLDLGLPGMSGLELLGHVKEEFEMPPTTMMMITAYGDDASYQQAMQLGANDFLTKPVDFAVLKEKLLHLLP